MKKLNIALLVTEFEDPYAEKLSRGASKAAKELGHNLFVFPGKFMSLRITPVLNYEYEYQHNCLFQFVSEKQIDIILVNLGNISCRQTMEDKLNFLKLFHIPVILIADNVEGYSGIMIDNSTGVIRGIDHLVTEHNKQNFGYISGPRFNLDAIERQNAFIKAMELHGISKQQYRIAIGDFTSRCTGVIESLLDEFPQMDTLVCANDMMCFGAYEVFEKRGIVPGRDIAVMGFDDVAYSAEIKPGLATVKADPSILGYQSVYMCERVLAGEELNVTVESEFVRRPSCGCEADYIDAGLNAMPQYNMESMNRCMVDISGTMLNYEEENNKLYSMILENVSRLQIKAAYIYTFEEEILFDNKSPWKKPESVRLRAYYRESKKRIPVIEYQPMPVYYYPVNKEDIREVARECQQMPFDEIYCNEFMPDALTGTWVVTMLYAADVQYGFMMWNIEPEFFGYVTKLAYQISNAIKLNRLLRRQNQMAQELEQAVRQVNEKNAVLEEISKLDELTQILNRRGFLDHMKRHVITGDNAGKKALAIYADMNDLKIVNDKFGHDQGDYALKTIAEILREAIHAVSGQGAAGRIGGDEFCAYIITDEEFGEAMFREKVAEITRERNQINGKPYYITMSLGIQHFICSPEVEITEELEKADARLYIDKRNKPKNIIKS